MIIGLFISFLLYTFLSLYTQFNITRVKYTNPCSHKFGLRVVNPRDTLVEVIVLSNDSEEDVGAITPSRPNDLIELSDSEEIDVQNLTIVFFVGAAIAPSVSNDLAELNNSEEVDIGDMTIHYKNICDLIDKILTKLCQLFRQLGDPDSDT